MAAALLRQLLLSSGSSSSPPQPPPPPTTTTTTAAAAAAAAAAEATTATIAATAAAATAAETTAAAAAGVVVLVSSLAAVLLVVLGRAVYMAHDDPHEPPVLRPKVPYFGHALSIFQEGGSYYGRLYKAKPGPIYTLPVLGGKQYVINSTALISAALRSQNLSFEPFIEVFSRNALAVSKEEAERLRDPEYIPSVAKLFYPSMSGEHLRKTAGAALGRVAGDLNRLGLDGEVCEVPHVGNWLRDVMSQAIMAALYGEKNPMTLDRIRDVWCVLPRRSELLQEQVTDWANTAAREFDRKVTVLTMGLAPRVLAPKAVAARERIQAALAPFYLARHDEGPDVSAFVRNRAAARRQMGAKDADLAAGESDIPWAALINTIPTLAWVFLNVFSRPNYVDQVRLEVLEATHVDRDRDTIEAAKLETKPFLGACFQEVQRLYNKLCGYRCVLEDTVLRDADGREYLLKKGNTVQWFHEVPHLDKAVWGEDADEFRAERFLDVSADEERRRRGAMIPFGGGKNLCPGRRFAVTEILGMVGAIALLFDVEGAAVPGSAPGFAACAMCHPAWGPNDNPKVRFRRRRDWDRVRLKFAV